MNSIPEEAANIKVNVDDDVSIENDEYTLLHDVGDSPPILTTVALAIQNIVLAIGTCVIVSFLLADLGCAGPEHPIRGKLFCSAMFMVGTTTIVQSALGIRLPVLQGVSGAFLAPLVTLKTSGIWTCPESFSHSDFNTSMTNTTGLDTDEILYSRLRQLQGSLMLAAVTETFIGCTGLVGFVLRFISPITISVAITLLGLTLVPVPVKYCNSYWPAAVLTIILTTLFSTYLANVTVKVPTCDKKEKRRPPFPVFQLFSILLSLLLGWLFCLVLTVTDVLPDDPSHPAYMARTDSRVDIVSRSPWFSFTYPGQFGPPSFSIPAFVGYLAAFASSEMESVGDYMAVAGVCKRFPPPKHAVNRAIFLEGLMAVFSGSVGTGHATTSYTANIAIIQFTKVASRSVMILAGLIAIVLSVLGKFGAAMSLIPYPALGGVYVVAIGILIAVAVSTLKSVDMTSSRNTAVFGISLYAGFTLSEWVKTYPDGIDTGILQADQILKVFLGTPMFTGSIISIFLDNTIPDRTPQNKVDKEAVPVKRYKEYEFQCVRRLQSKWKFLRHIPFLQPYENP